MSASSPLHRWIPELADAALERQFRALHHDDAIRDARAVLAIGCIAVLLPLYNDYLFWRLGSRFLILLAVRSVTVGAALGLMIAAGRQRQPPVLDRWMFAWTVLLVAQSAVASWFRPNGFTLDVLTWQLIVLACYLVVPLRYAHRLLCAVGGTVLYLGVIVLTRRMAASDLGPVMSAMTTTNLVAMVAALQINRLRRREYVRLLDEQAARRAEERAWRRANAMAEETSVAKSRFLAAASHDLRQPIHALGMLVGALRARSMDGDARRIVDHIDASIGATSELFTALLDVSRLDAGIVRPQLTTFPIQPLLERIRSECVEEAGRKGVRLVLHPSSGVVHSDPLLLGRILRNLVVNAVRYTDEGRIVIGCRRRGARLRVEVWDTGRGIAPEHRDRIFQEFYRIENDERDRSQGMGLGLAIVKRLTGLLDAPLHWRSQAGRGSLFAVDAALASGADCTVTADAEIGADAWLHGTVLVVDDDIAIQQAMKSLLESWGLTVIAAGSGREMREAFASCAVCPSLLICDYRLRDGERGDEVIQQLRGEFNEDIPGLLITGDTAPDRFAEAQASGFVLLHKPVSSGRLRAAVTSLMRAQAVASA
jgi:signal transduction histidine kinase/CheY-like chemotaxis protein